MKTCKSLTDPAQTYKLVIAHVGNVIGSSINDALTPRGLSCAATGSVSVGLLTDPAQTYKLVIAPVGNVIEISFNDAATPRGDYGRQNYSLFNKNNFLRGPGTYHDNRDAWPCDRNKFRRLRELRRARAGSPA